MSAKWRDRVTLHALIFQWFIMPIGIETGAEPPQNLFSESAAGRLLLAASLTSDPILEPRSPSPVRTYHESVAVFTVSPIRDTWAQAKDQQQRALEAIPDSKSVRIRTLVHIANCTIGAGSMVELVDKFDIGSLPDSERKLRTNEAEE